MNLRPFLAGLGILVLAAGTARAAGNHPTIDADDGWISLFNGKDLTGWTVVNVNGAEADPDAWVAEDGDLVKKGRDYVLSDGQWGDFVFDFEFKIDSGVNSGVFVRYDPKYSEGEKKYWTNGALEFQVYDSFGKEEVDAHDCGALYDMVAPEVNAVKKAGKWNHMTITAKGSKLSVVLNNKKILEADLDEWTEAQKNPDGSPLKYLKPMKDHPREGHLLLQDHGGEIRFRNLWIKPLD